MKKWLFIFFALAGMYQLWGQHKQTQLLTASANVNGFVEVLMPTGTKANTIYILAPQNCPREAGQRADALERSLADMGIPSVRSSNGSIQTNDPSAEAQIKLERTKGIIRGDIPAVFINGMARSNPSAAQVMAEYNRNR